MKGDYMDMGPALIVMDHYLRQTIEVASEYMDSLEKLTVLEQIGLDVSQIEYAYQVPVLCELEAARCLVGQAYTYRLIDVEDFHSINRMLNRFGLRVREVKQ